MPTRLSDVCERAKKGEAFAQGWLYGYEYGHRTPDEKLDREDGYVSQVRAER